MTLAPAGVVSCSIVICTYSADRLDGLHRCLDAVLDQSHTSEQVLVVVDNNPTLLSDLTAALAGNLSCRVVANDETPGLSGARNTGIKLADGEIVVFLDDDAVPEPMWLAQLLSPFDVDAVAAVGGRIDPGWASQRPWWFSPHLDWTIGCSIPTMPADGGPIRNVFGASAAFRRETLNRVGGFTADLGRVGANGAGCEETDLCIRVRADDADAVVLYAPNSGVVHSVSAGRATVRYVLRRCFAEGRSKARLAARVGRADATSNERAYARVIARQVWRDVSMAFRRPSGLGRAGVLVSGFGIAAVGYACERCSSTK